MSTQWEIGNDLRNICDRLFEIEKDCKERIDMVITEEVLKVCRLAIGHLSNKLCDDDVFLPANKDCLVEVVKVAAKVDCSIS